MATLISLATAPIASAAGTLDQFETRIDGSSNITETVWEGQTFTAGITGLLDQVDVGLARQGSSGPLTVQIRTVMPDGAPSNVVLATATLPEASVSTTTIGFVSVPLTPGTAAVAGTQYAIVLGAPLAVDPAFYALGEACGVSVVPQPCSGDPYPGGRALVSHTSAATWSLYSQTFDTAFRTYVVPSVPVVVAEAPFAGLLPLAALLLVFGLVLTQQGRRGSAFRLNGR